MTSSFLITKISLDKLLNIGNAHGFMVTIDDFGRIREGELEVAKQGRFDLIKAVKAGEK